MNHKIYFSLTIAFVLLLTLSVFLIPLNSFTAPKYSNKETLAHTLTFSTAGVINDITTSGSYNFTIQEAGLYKFKVEITGNITVDLRLYFERTIFSNYFERYISEYDLINTANDVSPDSPYEVILWMEHPGVGFFYVTKASGTSGTFSATVTPIKKVSEATTLTTGTTVLSIPKDSAYIGNFSVPDHSRAYNLTIEQRIPALPLTTIIKRAWVQIESIDNVNASHPVNITFIEDGYYEHSIGQITQNVTFLDKPLRFYFSVAYLNFTENSFTANQIKFNTTDPELVTLFEAEVMVEEADGDITSLHKFPLFAVIISDGSPYTTMFNLYDFTLSLDVGASASVMNPNGFLGFDQIASLTITVPARKVRDWILNEYNATPSYTGFIFEPQKYTFVISGTKVADSDITVYLNEQSYSILSINSTLDITFNKSEALFLGDVHIVLLNISNASPDALYQIQASMTGDNWTFVSLVGMQGTLIGEGPGVSKVDRPGYSYHTTTTMKDLHLLPVTMYSATNKPMEKLHITYFEERNYNGTYNSAMFNYRTNVYGPPRNTLMLFVMGVASNTPTVNSSEISTLTLSFTQTGLIESVTLDTMTKYTMNGNTTGFKILKLETQPGYEYNITIAPNNTQGRAAMEIISAEYRENVYMISLPQATTPLGESLTYECPEYGFTSSPKYIVINPAFNDTAVYLYVSETKYTDFPASGTAELNMGTGTNTSHLATLRFSVSPDEVYSIKITTSPGFVGMVSILYVTPNGKFPFRYTPAFSSFLVIPGGDTEVTYEYVGKISGDGFMAVYSSGTGTVYITITRRYLVPEFAPIPGLFLIAALPVALVLGLLAGRLTKREKGAKLKSRSPPKTTKTRKKK
ncbi:MAG: hypothetical protein J7L47_06435 [Candidatus Odinarchaeota archaeon]|nr:hypothetical protein [Candidatus Odinarchaeota archaeon]